MELEIIEKNIIELEFVDVEKYNPYHDSKGRFTSPGGAASFTIGNKSGLAWNQKNIDRAIAREKQRTADKRMKNPSGDLAADRKKEWEGADYAVQFKDGTYGHLDLHSKELDGKGNSWAEGAYGNMKIYAGQGSSSQIYMVDKKSYKDAMDAVNAKGIKDRKEAVTALENELKQKATRIIDKDYIKQQGEARKSPSSKPAKQPKTYADVKSKQDFVDYVEHRHNVKLTNDKGYTLNRKRDVLYTNIPKAKQHEVLNDFKKNGIRYEEHMNDNYFVYYKKQ